MKIIQGISILDVIEWVSRKNKIFQKHFLVEVEEAMQSGELRIDREDYLLIRKLFLDTMNNFMRSVRNALFSDDYEN